ncbi:MAG: hypothetical protein PHT88_03785 [Candidatus Moranbacteria bacterium]|nr:hypothetical protein [Candidatus Moranbacteria bacterium]
MNTLYDEDDAMDENFMATPPKSTYNSNLPPHCVLNRSPATRGSLCNLPDCRDLCGTDIHHCILVHPDNDFDLHEFHDTDILLR